MFTDNSLNDKNNRLIKALDLVNDKFGRNTLKIADEGLKNKHALKQNMRSRSYTMKWDEILEVKVKDKNKK